MVFFLSASHRSFASALSICTNSAPPTANSTSEKGSTHTPQVHPKHTSSTREWRPAARQTRGDSSNTTEGGRTAAPSGSVQAKGPHWSSAQAHASGGGKAHPSQQQQKQLVPLTYRCTPQQAAPLSRTSAAYLRFQSHPNNQVHAPWPVSTSPDQAPDTRRQCTRKKTVAAEAGQCARA